jgi:hypothetical protein
VREKQEESWRGQLPSLVGLLGLHGEEMIANIAGIQDVDGRYRSLWFLMCFDSQIVQKRLAKMSEKLLRKHYKWGSNPDVRALLYYASSYCNVRTFSFQRVSVLHTQC